MRVLVIDVGGTHIKVHLAGRGEPLMLDSGPTLTAAQMVAAVQAATHGWSYEAVSIGFPGPVHAGKALLEPVNLGAGWVDFDFQAAFGKPVQLINDAAMQALGSYQGGRMLFLGLGTGLGSALISDGVLLPLELAHLPYRKGKTFEDYVGARGKRRLGRKKWERHVHWVAGQLQAALLADYVVLGGGNVRDIRELPDGVRRGANANAFVGGERLWDRR